MSGKGKHFAAKRKQEKFNKKHPEGRTVFALKRKIERFIRKKLDEHSIKSMQERLKRIEK